MSPPRDTARFVPCQPPVVVRDRSLAGSPALLLGWWLDAAGQVEAVEVATVTSRRSPMDVTHFPRPPATPLPHAPGAFASQEPADVG